MHPSQTPPRPYLAVFFLIITVVLVLVGTLYVACCFNYISSSIDLLVLGGLLIPPALLTGVLSSFFFRRYHQRSQLYYTWMQARQNLAQLTLGLDRFDTSLSLLPQTEHTVRTHKHWADIHEAILYLLKVQGQTEGYAARSADFKKTVPLFAKAVSTTRTKAEAILGSSEYWADLPAPRSAFDLLLRPIDAKAREVLFFLEDLSMAPEDSLLPRELRSTVRALAVLADEAAATSLTGTSHEERQAFLTRWANAEDNVVSVASRILAQQPLRLRSTNRIPGAASLRIALGISTGRISPESTLEVTVKTLYKVIAGGPDEWARARPWKERERTRFIGRAITSHLEPRGAEPSIFFAESGNMILVIPGLITLLIMVLSLTDALESQGSSSVGDFLIISFILVCIWSPFLAFLALYRLGQTLSMRRSIRFSALRRAVKAQRRLLNEVLLDSDSILLAAVTRWGPAQGDFERRLFEHRLASAEANLQLLEGMERSELTSELGLSTTEHSSRTIAYLLEYRQDLLAP